MSRLFSLAFLAALLAPAASAQFGIGAQLGTPTGVSAKFGSGSGALALAAGWDLDNTSELAVEGHYILSERRIPGDADLRLFYGPGAYIETRENARNQRSTQGGLSFGVGLSLFATRDIELYGVASPRLQLFDDTDFDFGGGIGGRIYF
ncbi:hypothetical protein [Rubricoccus marinus]|uniref:Outer membrane protein beta-barrel domain-containing protein n=1 Tax=Rubricoccus marinus TaxID=716817 RepID=A0A259TZ38_9BACT|nr:hypothetical protein [Rubricoccus marinus]OZC03022.1 hypothetical protein BSZ36_08595 [Rubricoccus marinus]